MSDLKFQLSDFLDVQSQHERTITIRMGTFKQLLKDKIKELAVKRCQDWLVQWGKRDVHMADTDYRA